MDYEIAKKIIETVVLLLAFVFTRYLVPYIKTVVSEKKLNVVKEYADIFVCGVEQKINEPGAGQKKKEQVIKLLTDKVNSIGIKLSCEDIDLLIEDAVKVMKDYSE